MGLNRKRLRLFLIPGCVFCFSIACASEPAPRIKDSGVPAALSLAQDFALPGIDGKTYKLSDYRGKQPVLLFFWTTWCPYCRKALTALNERYSDFVKDGIEVLGVDVGESPAAVSRLAATLRIPFKILTDENSDVSHAYNLLGVPTYLLIDKQGYIVYQGSSFPKTKIQSLAGQ